MGKLIGYARVSTNKQDTAAQVKKLQDAGCEQIFQDVISGAKAARPGLDECLKTLQSGDCLVVLKVDRLGRSLPHLVQVVSELHERGVDIKSLQEGIIDTTSPTGKLVFNMFAVLAEFERGLIAERTKIGLDHARTKGRIGGRPTVTVEHEDVKEAKRLYEMGIKTSRILKVMNISGPTFYRYKKLWEAEQK